MESIGKAASRLLAELAKRARKTSGESPDKLQESGCVPLPVKEGRESATGKEAHHPGPVTVALSRGGGSDGLVLKSHANDNRHHDTPSVANSPKNSLAAEM